jgi:hypothetical protein
LEGHNLCCRKEELEAHFQAAKEYFQFTREIEELRKQGIGAGQAYRQTIGSCDNSLIHRFYAPYLYAYAMTLPLECVQTEDIPPLQKSQSQEPQEEAPGTVDALSLEDASEQSSIVPDVPPSPVGLLPAGIEYEDQSHTDTFSVSTESNHMQPDRLVIQFSRDETLEVTTTMFNNLMRQAVQEFEQKVDKEETQ